MLLLLMAVAMLLAVVMLPSSHPCLATVGANVRFQTDVTGLWSDCLNNRTVAMLASLRHLWSIFNVPTRIVAPGTGAPNSLDVCSGCLLLLQAATCEASFDMPLNSHQPLHPCLVFGKGLQRLDCPG
mmetsp:Transcript_132940/g.265293  ORF Transcript_132940/g.265293 Transcript_132940/m.265293 type:complete len:127 (+) Transcript_132940:36-416(+)